jgi:acyl-CoA synthetase (NDP forming)
MFFEPRGLAVIGKLSDGIFGGRVVVHSLLEAGYGGGIYPVNPGYEEVLGIKCLASVKDVPEDVDLALILVNARRVPDLLRECAGRGIRAAIVVSDGFAERDLAGARMQKDLVEMARGRGIRIIGPNTAGVVNTFNGFNPCPYQVGYFRLKRGPVTICSQTGMTNPQAVPYPELGLGVSKICDFGNKGDVDECDLLEYLEKDASTRVISMYLEGISDGGRFLKAAGRVAAKKPLLILKSGRTEAGALASASHTGSMAVDDSIFEAACRQTGIIRLEKFSELFELPKIFASQPLPRGNRMGIITYTGGMGVLATDRGAEYGLVVEGLSAPTRERLDKIFPGLGSAPVDIGPMAAAAKDFPTLFPGILAAVLGDDHIDSLLCVLWADPTGFSEKMYEYTYRSLKGLNQKPVATWLYGPARHLVSGIREKLEHMGYPVFKEADTAVRALGLAYRFALTSGTAAPAGVGKGI